MNFMLKHLKSYQLFESLKDEYEAKLREIELQKKDLLQDTKRQIDEHMYYILDDYQKDNSEDEIKDNGRSFVIVYKNIFCKLDRLEDDWTECDKFISLLENIFERIEKEFEVSVKLRASFLFDAEGSFDGRTEIHQIEHGFLTYIEKVKKWIDMVKDNQRESRPDYHTLQVEIVVS
jgi:hypothetical protein